MQHTPVWKEEQPTGSCDLGSSQKRNRAKTPSNNPELDHAQQFGSTDKQHGDMHGAVGLDENLVEPDDERRLQFGRRRGCSEKATIVAGDGLQTSVRRVSQGWSRSLVNGQASPSSWPSSSHTYQIADCFTEACIGVVRRGTAAGGNPTTLNHRKRNDAGHMASRERKARKVSSDSE